MDIASVVGAERLREIMTELVEHSSGGAIGHFAPLRPAEARQFIKQGWLRPPCPP